MKTPTLIGLTGYAGTGKDTARALLEEHGFHGFAFADPIKNMALALLESGGLDTRYLERRELKEEAIPFLGLSYREIMQTLGTEWGRARSPDLWLRLASAHVATHMHCGLSYFVVSDVRFLNEAAWVRKQGGTIWRIERDLAGPVREHVSESEQDQIKPDVTIHNNGPLADLRTSITDALGDAL